MKNLIIVLSFLFSWLTIINGQSLVQRSNLNPESEAFLQKSSKKSGIISCFGSMDSGTRIAHFTINPKLQCMHATFYLNDIQHQLIPLGHGKHILIKSRDIVQNKCGNSATQLDKVKDSDRVFDRMFRAVDTDVQRVLFAYTPKAKLTTPDIIGYTVGEVMKTNLAYANSGVNVSLSIALIYETNYSESYTEEICWNDGLAYTKTTDLCRFQDNDDGHMDEVHLLRNTYHADLCLLFVDGLVSNTGGQAYDVGAGEDDEAFCVVDIDGNFLSVAHEIGHLQGCHHDRYVLPGILTDYHHGYVHIDGNSSFRTIMAYAEECTDNNVNCPRELHFSDQTIKFKGHSTGDEHNPPGDAGHDNAQQIMDTKNFVASFRNFPTNVSLLGGLFNDQEYAFLPAFGTIQNQFFGTNTSYIVNSGGIVHFETEEKIVLRPGFQAKPGSFFNGRISK